MLNPLPQCQIVSAAFSQYCVYTEVIYSAKPVWFHLIKKCPLARITPLHIVLPIPCILIMPLLNMMLVLWHFISCWYIICLFSHSAYFLGVPWKTSSLLPKEEFQILAVRPRRRGPVLRISEGVGMEMCFPANRNNNKNERFNKPLNNEYNET